MRADTKYFYGSITNIEHYQGETFISIIYSRTFDYKRKPQEVHIAGIKLSEEQVNKLIKRAGVYEEKQLFNQTVMVTEVNGKWEKFTLVPSIDRKNKYSGAW